MSEEVDPVPMRHRNLEHIAMIALDAGRQLMESGAKAEIVGRGTGMVARGLGAERVYIRVGFASLALTVTGGDNTITRMIDVGAHGVNLRLNQSLRRLCARVSGGGMSQAETTEAFADLTRTTPRHSWILVCLAVGLACAAFGRLLGTDWIAFGPVLLGGAIGQGVRHHLLRRGVNAFVVTAIVAFVAAATAGALARLLGSGMLQTAMFASVLLLVPGVPVLNAQTDIMEGHPTLGSARAMTASMVLVFVTVGVWVAQIVLGFGAAPGPAVHHGVAHQALFGAVAAAGFGVLFNFGWLALLWVTLAGALALGVRTVGLDAGWSLAASSFAAAAAVGIGVHLLNQLPPRFGRVGNVLAVAGCIPMVPGSAAAHGIMGLIDLTAQAPAHVQETLVMTMEHGLSAMFTIGAIGAGLTIVTSLQRQPDFPS